MKVLSLFDGMACGMLAFQSAGLSVSRYVAYEIDKYAIQTSSHNFPMIEHKGDVFHADFTEYFDFDFLVGGSPCTYWSIAQKNNRETEASGVGWELFSQYVRALREAQPKFFIYENNKSMAKAIRESITETFGFEPICINSALVSAQNRQRLYWVGRRNEDGTYSQVHIEQPSDRGILLRDILDGGVVDREKAYPLLTTHQGNARDYFQKGHAQIALEPVGIGYRGRTENGKWVKRYESNGEEKANAITTAQTDSMVCEPVGTTKDGKSYCVTAYYSTGQNAAHTLTKGLASMVAEPIRIPEYGAEDKARPLNAHYANNCGGFEHRMFSNNPSKQQVDMIAAPVRVGLNPRSDGKLIDHQQSRIYSVDAKSTNLNANGGGQGAKTGLYSVPVDYKYAVPIEWDEYGRPTKARSGSDGKEYIVYEVVDGLITIKDKQYPIKLADGFYIIRKLTVTECKRLQTVPEWYEFPVSNAQAYKMLGNGWTVEVIAHLITSTQNVTEQYEEEQLTFF